MVETSVEIML